MSYSSVLAVTSIGPGSRTVSSSGEPHRLRRRRRSGSLSRSGWSAQDSEGVHAIPRRYVEFAVMGREGAKLTERATEAAEGLVAELAPLGEVTTFRAERALGIARDAKR